MTNERNKGRGGCADTMTVRMKIDLHDWLMDHRDSELHSLSDVVREVIEFWEQCQNE